MRNLPFILMLFMAFPAHAQWYVSNNGGVSGNGNLTAVWVVV